MRLLHMSVLWCRSPEKGKNNSGLTTAAAVGIAFSSFACSIVRYNDLQWTGAGTYSSRVEDQPGQLLRRSKLLLPSLSWKTSKYAEGI